MSTGKLLRHLAACLAIGMSLAIPNALAITTITDTWTGNDGDPWSNHWSFLRLDYDGSAITTNILANEGRLQSVVGGETFIHPYINNAVAPVIDAQIQFRYNGNGPQFGLFGRLPEDETNSFYYTYVQHGNDFLRIYRRNNGVNTQLGQVTLPFTVLHQTNYMVRFLIDGGGSTTHLHAKMWVAGDPEPGYQLSLVDNSTPSNLQGPGRFGLYTVNSPPARQFFFDNYSVTLIPEPTTVGMVMAGAVLMLAFRRR